MKKAIQLVLQPYEVRMVYIEGSGDEAIAQLPKSLQKDEDLCERIAEQDGWGSCTFRERGRIAVISVDNVLFSPGWFATLAHEILHFCTFALDASGVPPTDSNNDETLAYSVGWVMRNLLIKRNALRDKEEKED